MNECGHRRHWDAWMERDGRVPEAQSVERKLEKADVYGNRNTRK